MAGQNKVVGRAGILLVPYIDGVDFDTSQANHAGQQIGQAVNQGIQHANPGQATTQSVQHQPAQSTGSHWAKRLGVGIASGIAALGIGKLLKAGVETASSRADSNKVLSATLGLSPKDSKEAGKIAGDVYAGAYGESFSQVNDAVAAVAGSVGGFSKLSAKEIQTLTQQTLNLSSAFGIEVPDSISLISEMVENKLVPDFQSGTDLLTKGLQKVPAAFRGDLIDAIREYTPYYTQLGYSGEQAFNQIIKASKNGAIGIDKSADAIKEFGIRSTDMSKSTREAYTDLGLDIVGTTNAIAAGGPSAQKAIGQIADRLSKVPDKVDRSNIAISLFGTQLEDLGTNGSGIDDFVKSLKDTNSVLGEVKGTAAGVDKQLGSTNEATLEGLKRTFEQTLGEIAIPLLKALEPILKDIASFVTENKDAIKEWAGPILIVGGAIAAVIAVFTILSPIISAITGLMAIFGVTSLAALAPIILPILAVVAAIALVIAIVTLVIANWSTISAFFADLWSNVTRFFSEAGQNIANIWSGILSFFQTTIAGIGGFFQDIGRGIANFFIGIFNGITSFIIGAANTVTGIINGFLSFMFGGLNQLASFVSTISGGLINVGFSVPQLPILSAPVLPTLATGGVIKARPGGTAVIAGEAGRDEVVSDRGLTNKQLAASTQLTSAVVKTLQKGNGGGRKVVQNNKIDASSMNPYQLERVLTNRNRLVAQH